MDDYSSTQPQSQTLASVAPVPFLSAIAIMFGFMAFIAWDQSHWWRNKEDYGFGWLVPLFVLFVFNERLPAIKAALAACREEGAPRAGKLVRAFFIALTVCAISVGGLLFLGGAFYRAGTGPSFPGTLSITLGSIGLVFSLLYLTAPRSTRYEPAARWYDDARVRVVSLFIFPVMVWLVSAPMVSLVENGLSLFLLHRVTSVVFFVFDVLGLPIEQRDNVLVLPTGEVGVAEACSGIRSLTACLFAGSFLAAVFMKKLWKKIALVACSMGFAFLTNLIRSIFLTSWAYQNGPEAIEGFVHDAAGYTVLGLTVIGLLSLLPLFNMKVKFSASGEDDWQDEG